MYKSGENPRLVHQVLLNDTEVAVQCAVSVTKINGPTFFLDTINFERYSGQTLAPFFDKLSNGLFQQKDATTHTPSNTWPLHITYLGTE